MADPFSNTVPAMDAPARNFAAVTFDAFNNLPTRPRFLVVGTAGTLVIDGDNATSITVTVPAGIVPLSPLRIRSGTAASVVACW